MMTKEQKDRIKNVIHSDAKLKGRMMDANGDTCAVGGLLKAAGVPDGMIREFGCIPYTVLEAYFGLNRAQVDQIMSENDKHYDVATRRTAICAKVDTF